MKRRACQTDSALPVGRGCWNRPRAATRLTLARIGAVFRVLKEVPPCPLVRGHRAETAANGEVGRPSSTPGIRLFANRGDDATKATEFVTPLCEPELQFRISQEELCRLQPNFTFNSHPAPNGVTTGCTSRSRQVTPASRWSTRGTPRWGFGGSCIGNWRGSKGSARWSSVFGWHTRLGIRKPRRLCCAGGAAYFPRQPPEPGRPSRLQFSMLCELQEPYMGRVSGPTDNPVGSQQFWPTSLTCRPRPRMSEMGS